jgi:predicted DNA-binding transcriptional regulator YafY
VTRPTARVLGLLELLQSGGVRTAGELASRLDVDERTVRRYAQHLIDLDIPVESVRGRYGGYRLARGHRLPPLMLAEDEALAVLLGLASQSAGTAGETAAAKLRRVLPAPLKARLDALLESLAFTAPGQAAPDSAILLPLAAAVRDHQPMRLTYAGRGEREFHPYGLVVHSGRWYVTGLDPAAGEERTLRLDRIESARAVAGSFDPPVDFDLTERLLTGFATAGYRHEVRLRIQATVAEIRTRLPASIAVVHESDEPWLRVDMRAENLDWIPGLLASLDHPFVIEQPAELRTLVAALADRLAASASRAEPIP